MVDLSQLCTTEPQLELMHKHVHISIYRPTSMGIDVAMQYIANLFSYEQRKIKLVRVSIVIGKF